MGYYWTIDGVPQCRCPLTGSKAIETFGDRPPAFHCSFGTREEAAKEIATFEMLCPGHNHEVVEGSCPAYAEDWAIEQEHWLRYEED